MPSLPSCARRIARHACHASLILFPLSDGALAEAVGLAESAHLPEVRVSANAAGSGYVATDAAGATRTGTPLREVAQSVRVLTAELIDDLDATRLSDTVDYVSGIARLNDFGGTWDNYAIRGFSSTDMGYLVNGFPGARGYNPMRDAATVERFEFLKGPAAALYGSSEPGGTINIVTKKPRFTRATAAELSAGTLGFRRATVDTTGPLGRRAGAGAPVCRRSAVPVLTPCRWRPTEANVGRHAASATHSVPNSRLNSGFPSVARPVYGMCR